MADATTSKVVIIGTHGPEDPERATLPFVMGNAALAMDSEAVIILQATGVLLAKTGTYEHIFASGLPPLQDLLKSFLALGGKLLICTPCIQDRKIEPSMLIEGAEMIAGARVIAEVTESTAVLNY